jgi:hypothetical protein
MKSSLKRCPFCSSYALALALAACIFTASADAGSDSLRALEAALASQKGAGTSESDRTRHNSFGLNYAFTTLPGAAFIPTDNSSSGMFWSSCTYGYWCLHRPNTSGSGFVEAPILLPDGASLEGIRIYYYDSSAVNDVESKIVV